MSIEQVPNIDLKPEPTFAEYAATMPDTEQGFLDSPIVADAVQDGGNSGATVTGDGPTPAEKKTKRIKLSKKMQRTMDKFRSKSAKLPIMWFHNQAKEHPEWELDDEEQEFITDSVDTLFEILDVEIQIEQLNITLTSIWWVISYPIVVFIFLFLSKKALTVEKEQKEAAEK